MLSVHFSSVSLTLCLVFNSVTDNNGEAEVLVDLGSRARSRVRSTSITFGTHRIFRYLENYNKRGARKSLRFLLQTINVPFP